MKMNQFDKAFQSAITEIRLIEARLGVLDVMITQAKEKISNNSNIGNELLTTIFTFRDITVSKQADNLFAPNDAYSLTQINLIDELALILSRESLFQIAQAYEILETYLYDQVTEFIRLNHTVDLPIDYKPTTATFLDIRITLKRLKDRTNNRHLLGILRTNIAAFAKHETDNIYDVNFKEWFEMLSEVRHSVTHRRGRLTEHLDSLSPCFIEYFATKEVDSKEVIFTNVYNSKELLSRLGDYIYFVYKCTTDFTFELDTKFSTISHVFHDPHNNTLLIP